MYYLDVAENIEGYWRLVDPVWEQIDIYRGADVFLATYRAAENASRAVVRRPLRSI